MVYLLHHIKGFSVKLCVDSVTHVHFVVKQLFFLILKKSIIADQNTNVIENHYI